MQKINAISHLETKLFYAFGFLTIACSLLAFYFNQNAFFTIPFFIPIAYLAITNFKVLYFLLLFSIPLSLEFQLSESLGTDLPTEPLMLILMLSIVFYLIQNIKSIDFSFFKNSIIFFLIIHLFWISLTSFTSLIPAISYKFLAAKSWYIFSFLIGTALFIRNENDLKKLFWTIYIPLSFTIVYALIRHSFSAFHFDEINPALAPFYRNHVVYANLISIFFPFLFLAKSWYVKSSFKHKLMNISIVFYLIAIYFSYTRASYLAVLAMLFFYVVLHFKLMKITILASIIGVIAIFGFIIHENYYLKYSPTVKTVSHHELSDIIDATLKGTDVSSMERVYRWVAAIHMAYDRPITGFGPNGFVPHYKNYTVFLFETWISENEERSGVHNYFLMTIVEQGFFGLVVLLGLFVSFFLFTEKKYHQSNNTSHKKIYLAAFLAMIALVISSLFSDLLEVDKIGSLFFILLSLVILVSRNFKGLMQESKV